VLYTLEHGEDERRADRLAVSLAGVEMKSGPMALAPSRPRLQTSTIRGERRLPPGIRAALDRPGARLREDLRLWAESGLGLDLSAVRVRTDADASASAKQIGADAYTVGTDVVVRTDRYSPDTTSGRKLLAHELAHVVAPPVRALIARQVDTAPAPDGLAGSRGAQLAAVRAALRKPDPIAGVGDFGEAYRIIEALNIDDQIWVIRGLNNTGELDILIAHNSDGGAPRAPLTGAAMQAVRLLDLPASSLSKGDYDTVAMSFEKLAAPDRDELVTALVKSRSPLATSALTIEGLMAMMTATSGVPDLNPSFAGVTGPVAPGPWAPPGGQPIPFYIGTAAHVAIANEYRLAHPGERVETNYVSVEVILAMLSQPPFNLTPDPTGMRRVRLEGMPDIANLSLRHIYEIKPRGSETLARTEAAWYVTSFTMAGIPMKLGPRASAGTSGVVPAPGGVYIFECVEPGVIVYQLRRAEVVAVPAAERSAKRRFELRPLTPQQAATVGITAAIAAILMYLAESAWVFAL
jgi:hypothetical protein